MSNSKQTITPELRDGDDVLVKAKFSHYGVGSHGKQTAYLFIGSQTVVFDVEHLQVKLDAPHAQEEE